MGGNCKTTMMAMVSPAMEGFAESLSTLKFANRAKNIKNEARINEDLDQRALLRKYEKELKRLRAELDRRTRQLLEKREVMKLQVRGRCLRGVTGVSGVSDPCAPSATQQHVHPHAPAAQPGRSAACKVSPFHPIPMCDLTLSVFFVLRRTRRSARSRRSLRR